MSFLGDIPMTVTVNGKETYVDSVYMGYAYSTGTTSSDLIMWFEFTDNRECLYIANYDEAAAIPIGNYEISLTILESYMEDGQSEVLEFVLNVGSADVKSEPELKITVNEFQYEQGAEGIIASGTMEVEVVGEGDFVPEGTVTVSGYGENNIIATTTTDRIPLLLYF